ncbi:unnamed protein product [Arabis nemorensis]|uniref:Uncharacterized protein n=1 Tax=Arabis nemorensis TaxID=586526 RepID=A0A565BBY0_9BRAS|nr:unnamed protein product [Arabis nemorensis]
MDAAIRSGTAMTWNPIPTQAASCDFGSLPSAQTFVMGSTVKCTGRITSSASGAGGKGRKPRNCPTKSQRQPRGRS